jgi:hypothetical protein
LEHRSPGNAAASFTSSSEHVWVSLSGSRGAWLEIEWLEIEWLEIEWLEIEWLEIERLEIGHCIAALTCSQV